MPALIDYLLKVNLALILFYLAYRFGLRKLTFYQLNRWFLLFGILFASLYPFIDLSALFRQHMEPATGAQLLIDISILGPATAAATVEQLAVNYWQLMLFIFWLGVACMAIRMLMQLFSLYRLHRSSRPASLMGYKFRELNSKVNPFSFWQTVYLNPAAYGPVELEAIFRHEQVHVKEWHTADVLLGKLTTILHWFNPAAWLMQQALVENLEFITDRKTLQSGIDHQSYQYSLLRMSSGIYPAALTSNFSVSTIKKRIIMMNSKHSSALQISRYTFIIPVLAILLLFFAGSNAQTTDVLPADTAKPEARAVAANNGSGSIKRQGGNNSDEEVLRYVIDPNNFTDSDFREMRNIFSEKGYALSLHKEYNGPDLETVKVTMRSAKGSASATYTVDKLNELDYVIVILAKPATDEISILSQKKTE